MCAFILPRRRRICSLTLRADRGDFMHVAPGSFSRITLLLGALMDGPLTSLELSLGAVEGGLGDWMFHLPQLRRLRLQCPCIGIDTPSTGCELGATFSRLGSLTHLSLNGFNHLTFEQGALPASLRELEVVECFVECAAGGGDIAHNTLGPALAAAGSQVQGLQSLTVGIYEDVETGEAQELGLGHLTERFSGITRLSLRVNDSLPGLQPLGTLPQLRVLDFGFLESTKYVAEEDLSFEYEVWDYLAESVAPLTQLTSLSLDCGLTHFPRGLERLWQSTRLKVSSAEESFTVCCACCIPGCRLSCLLRFIW